MAAKPQSVIIADDHHLIVDSLKLLVEQTLGLNCVAAVYDGQSCIESASEHKPDLILLDLDMPRIRGDDAINLLRQVSVDSKILVITGTTTPNILRAVWNSGADGIILKGSPVNEICDAISRVLSGQRYAGTKVSTIIRVNSAAEKKFETLTRREREVFELLLQKISVSMISSRLNLSPKTVDNHKTQIMAKLEVHSRAELIAFGVRMGLQKMILNTSVE